ncbi:RsmB/NOP family class I SAM-dependent RNA methyltransferase [Candidatus Woesearchaeota archaeon]|nr:RsmB/NOP family class I SAM-dependent RNA methyltransferase [Candidatus Woesearchaeota archaeon]
MNFSERYADLGWHYKPCTPLHALRVNTLLIEEKKLLEKLKKKNIILEKAEHTKYGHFIQKTPFPLSSTLEYLKGYFFLQDAATQKAVELLNPHAQDLVLDMCSSPGGKTTHLAQLMQNKGVIVALELKRERMIALKNNLERCQIRNSLVYNINSKDAPSLGILFDKILLDAPCSGNFTQEKDWFQKRNLEGIQRNASLQRELLASAFHCLKNEGELVYSTCSLEPEENEENCAWFQKEFPVKMLSFERIWPDKTTGFFMAKFKKTGKINDHP